MTSTADTNTTSTSKFDFTGKVALITGSSSGIGAAIAIAFAQHGARCTITGRDSVTLGKVAERIQHIQQQQAKVGDGTTTVVQPPLQLVGSLNNRSFVPKLITETIAHYGRLDILVNNAGSATSHESYDDAQLLEEFDRLIELNVRSVVHLTQLAVPYLEQTKGNIINISSDCSLRPARLVYSTSKAALDMVTKTSAGLLGSKGIRVNSINPGPVRTAIGRSIDMPDLFTKQADWIKDVSPLSRIAEPEEIADLAVFIASNVARNMTGSIVSSDGGMSIRPT